MTYIHIHLGQTGDVITCVVRTTSGWVTRCMFTQWAMVWRGLSLDHPRTGSVHGRAHWLHCSVTRSLGTVATNLENTVFIKRFKSGHEKVSENVLLSEL